MPSSSLFLRSSTTLISLLSFVSTSFAAPLVARDTDAPEYTYTLAKSYQGSNFFSENDWTYFPNSDPTHGFVTYGNKQYADSNQLIGFEGDYAVIKVDSKTKIDHGSKTYYKDNGDKSYHSNNGIGRKSLRIEGKYEFTHGLIITDIGHMPTGICGTWPAFWTLGTGTQWPVNGEIDIIEGSNAQQGNWMSLHTSSSSNINGNTDSFSAKIKTTDCNLNNGDPNGLNYAGCTFEDPDPATYSAYTGGVWATQWTSDKIKIWYWPYGSVPSDVTNGTPRPSSAWGTPRSSFAPPASLRADANFYKHHVIFDTTFCGDLGDSTWATTGCAARTGYDTCADFVANEPGAFKDANWKVKYVKIYSEGSVATTSSTMTTTTSKSSSSTTATTTTTKSSSSITTTKSSTVSSTATTKSSSLTTTTQSSVSSTSSSTSLTTKSTSTTSIGSSSTAITESSTSSSATQSTSTLTTTATVGTSSTTKVDSTSVQPTSEVTTKPTSTTTLSNTSATSSTSKSTTTKSSSTTEASTLTVSSTSGASSVIGGSASSDSSSSKTTQTTEVFTFGPTSSPIVVSSNGWENWSTVSSRTSKDAISSMTVMTSSKSTTTTTTKQGGGFYPGKSDGYDQWITTTVIDITTVPCSTAPGYETKTYSYVTVIPSPSGSTTISSTWDPSKPTTISTEASESWSTWDPSKTTSESTQPTSTWGTWDPKASSKSAGSTTTWNTWDPSKPASKTTGTSSVFNTWSASSSSSSVRGFITGTWSSWTAPISSSKPTSVDPSWASRTSPVATQTTKPQSTQWSTWTTKASSVSASTVKTPDASATTSGNWNAWNANTAAGTTENIAIYKGSAAAVKVQGTVMIVFAFLGGMMLL